MSLNRYALAFGATLAIAAPVSADEPWPEQLGPFWIGEEGSDARLRVAAWSQTWLVVDNQDTGSGRVSGASLDVHRIRTQLIGDFLQGRITSFLHFELAPSTPELIDLWVEGQLHPEARLRVGQMKVPFVQYWQPPPTLLLVSDWPITSRYFGGERQLGLMVHNTQPGHAGFEYAFGLFGGENRRSAQARELPAVYGEEHGNPSALGDPRGPGPIHAEMIGRIGYHSPGVHAETPFDVQGGGPRFAANLSAAWDTDPVRTREFTVRFAPEFLFKWEHLSFMGIGYFGFVPTAEDYAAPGAAGVLVGLGWHLHRHFEVALRFSRVDLFSQLQDDSLAYAFEREPSDPDERTAWIAQYRDNGRLRARQELAFGFNVLIVGRSLTLQNDISWVRTERFDGTRDDLLFRSQLQFWF